MFFDKLWVRIRGELLNLREDLSQGGELRERAEEFLAKLEHTLDPERGKNQTDGNPETRIEAVAARIEEKRSKESADLEMRDDPATIDTAALEDLKKSLEEIRKTRAKKHTQPDEAESTAPNPRRLG